MVELLIWSFYVVPCCAMLTSVLTPDEGRKQMKNAAAAQVVNEELRPVVETFLHLAGNWMLHNHQQESLKNP